MVPRGPRSATLATPRHATPRPVAPPTPARQGPHSLYPSFLTYYSFRTGGRPAPHCQPLFRRRGRDPARRPHRGAGGARQAVAWRAWPASGLPVRGFLTLRQGGRAPMLGCRAADPRRTGRGREGSGGQGMSPRPGISGGAKRLSAEGPDKAGTAWGGMGAQGSRRAAGQVASGLEA